MGVFEFEKFSKGTFAIADVLAGLGEKGVTTIIGGALSSAGSAVLHLIIWRGA